MDLQPIKMSWQEARDVIRQYGAVLKEKRIAEDLAILRSTKAILAGKMVIRLADAVEAGGYIDTPAAWPKVAVARADDRWVKCVRHGDAIRFCGTSRRGEYLVDWGTSSTSSVEYRAKLSKPRAFEFTASVSTPASDNGAFRYEADAMVPTVPPAHRPPPDKLDRYWILFEASWQEKPQPPADPALLSPLGGGLYAVVAVWNLTDVERAVLATSRGV